MTIAEAVEKVLDRVVDTYLGEDGPMEMTRTLRFSYAMLGVTMYFVGLLLALTARTAPDDVTAAMTSALNNAGVSEGSWLFPLLAALIICPMIALPITHGIRRGGPLRFFLLGVTVPGFVTFVVSAAFPSGGQ